MKRLREYIVIGESTQGNLQPTSSSELKEMIRRRVKQQGQNCDLNDIDVSRIVDMSGLFKGTWFNGDISSWDVSNVKNMSRMFCGADFNGNISGWDVSNVENMSYMFAHSRFNGDISRWDVSSVENVSGMFEGLSFWYRRPSWYKVKKKLLQY